MPEPDCVGRHARYRRAVRYLYDDSYDLDVVRSTLPPTGFRRAFIARWYVTLTGLLVTVALCAAAAVKVPVQYQAKSVTLLLPAPTQTATNPYTNLSSLAGLTDVLSPLLTTPEVTARVKQDGNVGTYTVSKDLSSSGPIVLVTATADSPAHSMKLATYVTNLIPGTLKSLQSSLPNSVPVSAYITSRVINPVDKTTPVAKNRTRALVVAAAVGLLLTALLVVGVERWAGRRRRTPGERGQSPGRGSPQPRATRPVRDGSAVVSALPLLETGETLKDAAIKVLKVRRGRARSARNDGDKSHEAVEAGH